MKLERRLNEFEGDNHGVKDCERETGYDSGGVAEVHEEEHVLHARRVRRIHSVKEYVKKERVSGEGEILRVDGGPFLAALWTTTKEIARPKANQIINRIAEEMNKSK